MSKNKVEENAVIEVRNTMKKSDKILSKNIEEGDKEQSTDGFLSIYLDNPDKKSSFLNNIDVQVKGRTSVNLPTAKNINFQMEIQDLENYKKLGGCIVFYVAFTKDFKDFNIYVKPLLPYEINIILQNGQKSKDGKKTSIKFRKIGKDDYKELEKICYQFLQDKDKQYSYKEKNYTLQDLKNTKGKLEISWSVPKNYELKTKDMFDEDKFMYFVPEGFERVKIPVGIGKIHLVGYRVDNDIIEIGNKEYQVGIEMEKIHNDTLYKIGNSITYYETKEHVFINLAGLFSRIDKEIKIVEEFLKYKKLTINKKTIEVEDKDFSIVYNQINYMRKLQAICKILKISEEIFIDFRDKESVKNIYLLEQGIINKKAINFQCTYDTFASMLKIFNKNIAIFAKKKDNINNYEIIDLFEELMNDNTEIYFEIQNSKEILNIEPKFMIFQQSKFNGFENFILTSANIINKYDSLFSTLKQFKKNANNEDMAKACICILLQYKLEYEMIFNNFNDETKEFFKSLPIYNLID